MSSRYIDTTAIVQVIGCTFKQPNILDNTDQYNITEEDFVEEFHKIIFGSIYNIHLTGSQVNMETIVDYLSGRPKAKAIFDKYRGVEYLTNCLGVAQENTFNYYYQRLKKMTLLRAYDNFGLDMSFVYDPNEILDSKKRQEQEDWLDRTSLVEIAHLIDNKIDEIKAHYVDDDCGQGYQAADGLKNLVEDLKQHPEFGIPLYGPLINTVTRGARLRKFYLRSGATGTGKAIPNNTIIPTPAGNKRVDEIKVNDYLFGDDGKPTKVLAVYPQPQKKQVYVVEFSDGRQAKCCKDHLWEYYDGSLKIVESTEQIKTKMTEDSCFKVKVNKPLWYNNGFLSIEQRDILLKRLLISGHGFAEDNKICFTFGSPELNNSVVNLCRSLGYVVSKKKDYFCVQQQNFVTITNIYSTDEWTNMTCFSVDNKSHLFLMNDYIVTHNTRTMVADACYFACSHIYDPDFDMWIKCGVPEPTLYITTEQDKSEIQTMMLAFVSYVNEEHILSGRYEEGEEERIERGIAILGKSPLWIEELPDFSLQDVENKIKKYIREHDVKYVCQTIVMAV